MIKTAHCDCIRVFFGDDSIVCHGVLATMLLTLHHYWHYGNREVYCGRHLQVPSSKMLSKEGMPLARRSTSKELLSYSEEVQIWLDHLQKKKINCVKATKKAAETELENKHSWLRKLPNLCFVIRTRDRKELDIIKICLAFLTPCENGGDFNTLLSRFK